ncbi:MAG: carboxypeptidase regulatory-like domain-containing protein, partial [Candidatus Eisenbacteria bacterium]
MYSPSGVPSIAYYEALLGDLRFATRGVSGWNIEVVDAAGDVGQYPSLAFDAAGDPHISYFDATNGTLKHIKKQTGHWNKETVDGSVGVGLYSSMGVSGDTLLIAYFDATNKDLKVATKVGGGSWTTTQVDTAGDVGRHLSLCVNCHMGRYFRGIS